MKLRGFIAWALVGVMTAPVYAQTARSGGAPNAQLMQQMQQLASERTSLQAENAKLKKDLDDLRKERDELKKGQNAGGDRLKSAETALARSNTQRESAEKEIETQKAKTQELVAKFRETIDTLRDTESQFTASKQTLATRNQELKTCIDRNVALYDLNGEVLTHLEKQGVWSRMAQAEPFTRIKRAQLENLIDDYKSRASDQRAADTTANTAPAVSGPAGAR
jgi:chromosome segregation ATPase